MTGRRAWITAATALLLAGLLRPPGAWAQPAGCAEGAALLERAGELYARRQDPDLARQAARLYGQILGADGPCLEAALGRARALVWVGVLSQGAEEINAYGQAMEAARRAVREAPDDPSGYYWLGVSQALYANACGFVEGLSLVGQVRRSLERAMALEPAYEHGGPDRVLGRLYFKLPALMGGDLERAERHLRRALSLGPAYWLNHLYLAEVLRARGRTADALALVDQVLAGPALPCCLPEYQLWRQEAVELRERLDGGGEARR